MFVARGHSAGEPGRRQQGSRNHVRPLFAFPGPSRHVGAAGLFVFTVGSRQFASRESAVASGFVPDAKDVIATATIVIPWRSRIHAWWAIFPENTALSCDSTGGTAVAIKKGVGGMFVARCHSAGEPYRRQQRSRNPARPLPVFRPVVPFGARRAPSSSPSSSHPLPCTRHPVPGTLWPCSAWT